MSRIRWNPPEATELGSIGNPLYSCMNGIRNDSGINRNSFRIRLKFMSASATQFIHIQCCQLDLPKMLHPSTRHARGTSPVSGTECSMLRCCGGACFRKCKCHRTQFYFDSREPTPRHPA